MSDERTVKIAARLYEIRDAARRLCGANYKKRMEELGTILQRTSHVTGKSVIETATEVCTNKNLIGIDLILVMAAAVELIEPTKAAGGEG